MGNEDVSVVGEGMDREWDDFVVNSVGGSRSDGHGSGHKSGSTRHRHRQQNIYGGSYYTWTEPQDNLPATNIALEKCPTESAQD